MKIDIILLNKKWLQQDTNNTNHSENQDTVELFTNLRKYIGYKVLEKKMKHRSRRRAFYNLNTARSVGILFSAVTEEKYKITRNFFNELKEKGIDVQGLGYVKHQEMINYLPHFRGIELFAIEQTNWYYFPKDEHVKEFLDAEFDILIDLTSEDFVVLKFISGLSRAHLKVGKDIPHSRYYDLALAMKQDTPTGEFIELVKHYFQVLKSPKELVMN